MKRITTIILILLSALTNAQVGIGTTTPQATLQITGNASSTTTADGILAPRLTGDQLKAKSYTASQTGVIVYVTAAVTTPDTKTAQVSRSGYYYYDGTKWRPFISAYYGSINIGDLTTGTVALTGTGFVAYSTASASRSVVAGGYDILVTHNLNLSANQVITISLRSNVTGNNYTQYDRDNEILKPVVHDVGANSFRIYLNEISNVVQNITMMLKLANIN